MRYLITPLMGSHTKYKFCINELSDMTRRGWVSDALRSDFIQHDPMHVPELITNILQTLEETEPVIFPDIIINRRTFNRNNEKD